MVGRTGSASGWDRKDAALFQGRSEGSTAWRPDTLEIQGISKACFPIFWDYN